MDKAQRKALIIMTICGAFTIGLTFYISASSLPEVIKTLLYFLPYLITGYGVLIEAGEGILKGEIFDENFLMAVASIGAFAMGEYGEAVAVMIFFRLGELFEDIAVDKSRKNIADLMDIRPDIVNVCMEDGSVCQQKPEEVQVGTEIVIYPGEKIPLDGKICKGETSVNTSALTGESAPRYVKEGDAVISGCVNENSAIYVITEKEYKNSTVCRILELTENSAEKKAKSEAFITKFARYYTPAVCGSALLLFLIPSIITGNWSVWGMRALSFLVTSCPCALVISVPLTFFGAIGGASSRGILVKGGNYIETLSNIETIAFDKTGTLTKGVFQVTGVYPADGISEQALLDTAAAAEMFSTHPIAKALTEGRPLTDSTITQDVKAIPGKGVSAVVKDKLILAGNALLMKENGIDVPASNVSDTCVHVASDGRYMGYIVISDTLKDSSSSAVHKLHSSGINTVMLTGDAETSAKETAEKLGIKEYHFGLLPADKVSFVEKLLSKIKEGKSLAFVGDGINDAPVIARADVGIAMGALGSDAAVEAADVVLMDDNPEKISEAIDISRKCMKIVKQNIIFAIGAKLLCLLLVAVGATGMWLAVFADVGVMVIAVLNSTRMLKL